MIISNFDNKAVRILDSEERRIPKNKIAFGEWNKANRSRLNGLDVYAREKLYYIETVVNG